MKKVALGILIAMLFATSVMASGMGFDVGYGVGASLKIVSAGTFTANGSSTTYLPFNTAITDPMNLAVFGATGATTGIRVPLGFRFVDATCCLKYQKASATADLLALYDMSAGPLLIADQNTPAWNNPAATFHACMTWTYVNVTFNHVLNCGITNSSASDDVIYGADTATHTNLSTYFHN